MEHRRKSDYYDQEFKIEGLNSVDELIKNMDDVFYQKKNELAKTSIENMKKKNTINLLSTLKSCKNEGTESDYRSSESPARIDSPEGIIDKRINASNIVLSRNYYNSNNYYSNYFNNPNNNSPNQTLEQGKTDNNSSSKISKSEYSKIMIDKSDELYNSINVKAMLSLLKIYFYIAKRI